MASVEVDFAAKQATVTCKPGRTLTREAVAKAFDGTHYSVATFEPK